MLHSKNVFAWPSLVPTPAFFEDVLADDVVLVSQDGQLAAKYKVVEPHRPGKGPKFTRVEMSDMQIVDHGAAAVVTCQRPSKVRRPASR